MRRLSKALCVALSLSMLINLAGFDVLAADADVSGTKSEADADTGSGNVTDDKANDKTDDKTDASGDIMEGADTAESDVNGKTDGADVSENNEEAADIQENDAVTPEEEETEPKVEAKAASEVKAAPVSGSDKLKISWNSVPDATGYKVEVLNFDKKTPVNGYTTEVPATGTMSVEIPLPSTGTKYLVRVTAVKAASENEIGTIPVIVLKAPEKSSIKASEGSTVVKLSWTAAGGATAYQVTYGSKTATTSTASYSATGLENGKEYNFQIKSICKITYDKTDYTYYSDAVSVSAKPKSEKPAKVTGLSGIDGEKSAILTWSKAARADSYTVYRYNSSKKKWVVVKTNVKKLTYTDKKLTSGKKYKYRVAAVNDGGTGTVSSTVTISVKKTPGTKVRTIGYKAIVKSRAPIFTGKSSSKRVKYLSKGTRITTIDYGKGRYQFKLSNGKTYWISKDRLTFTASIWTTKDYSTKTKEDFVNKKGYSSPSKYLIWINQYTQRVIIFQGKKGKWKMIRNCRCATGTHLHMTPKGKYKITYKEKGWFYRTTYEKPIVHFQSQNSFHSRIKNYKGGYADATIGRPRSKGCVRLYDEDITFIYKKCPKGTTVISH